ncbi:PAS domain S-box protein [Candidatus Riflebacteria bacterium]
MTTETVLIDKNGKQHIVEFSLTPMVENGEVVRIQGITRNITERKMVEEGIKESEKSFACSRRHVFTSGRNGSFNTFIKKKLRQNHNWQKLT